MTTAADVSVCQNSRLCMCVCVCERERDSSSIYECVTVAVDVRVL